MRDMLYPAPELTAESARVLGEIDGMRRDLRDLVSTGVLESVGRTRARYYTEGPHFPEAALAEARTPRAIINPYEG